MERSMKKFAGLVVILAVLILGGYYVTGLITERTLKKNVMMINQSSGLFVDIKQYDRGWFTSLAKLSWRLHIPERLVKNQDGQSTTVPAQDYDLDMPLTIYHGPVIIADSGVKFGLGYASTDLALPPTYDAQFSTMFTPESVKPRVNLNVLVNYLNRSRLRVTVPTFKVISKDGKDEFDWLGLENDVTISSNLDVIKGDLTIDGMHLKKDNMHTTVGKMTSDYDLKETKEGLYLGDAKLSFPSLIIKDNEQTIFELQKFDMYSESNIDSGLFSTYFKASIEKIMAQGKEYGPGVFKMDLKNLDAEVLARINKDSNKLQQGTEQERQQALFNLLPELPKLFGQGAVLDVSELSFVMPEGKLEGELSIKLPKGEITNPFQLIQKVIGEGNIKLPAIVVKNIVTASTKKKLAQQPALQQAIVNEMQNSGTLSDDVNASVQPNPQQPADSQISADSVNLDIDNRAQAQADQHIAIMVQNGFLVKNGEDYTIEFKLEEGQLFINGKQFNPSMVKY